MTAHCAPPVDQFAEYCKLDVSQSSLIDRFEAKYIPEPNSGCWLWIGFGNQYGYGRIRAFGKVVLAHRLSYQMFKGPLTEGLELDHLCRVRCCVNPDHLEEVPHIINMRRGAHLSAACPSGHQWTEENTWFRRTGSRQCRQCNRDKQKLRRMRASA